MQEYVGLFNFGIILLFAAAALIWYRRNRSFLTPEERQRAGELVSRATWRETRHFWKIFIIIFLFVGFLHGLENYFGIAKASDLIFIFIWFEWCRTIIRNQRIYREADLPAKFVRGELGLGIFSLFFLASVIVYIFTD